MLFRICNPIIGKAKENENDDDYDDYTDDLWLWINNLNKKIIDFK